MTPLTSGRHSHMFNAVDDFNCEALSIEIDLNLLALLMVRELDRTKATITIKEVRIPALFPALIDYPCLSVIFLRKYIK